MKRLLPLLILAFCLLSLTAAAAPRPMPDFTVQTLNGPFSLSETLAEKKMVLINFFATWCPPCKTEFPYMEEAYLQYQDSAAVLALSVESNDSSSVLQSYAEELGLTFDVGSDSETSLSSMFSISSIPVTVVVDRFGNIVLEEVGARTSTQDFLNLFDYFTSDDYTESVYLNDFPAGRSDFEGESQETLIAVLGENAGLTYLNPENTSVWPMKAVQKDDRLVLEPAAPFTQGACSSVSVLAEAREGDILAFDLRTSTTDGVNLLTVDLDGNEICVYGGESDWTRYALSLPEGSHTIQFSFRVNMITGAQESIELDSFALLSGDEAVQALAANPVYPASDSLALSVSNPSASLLSFDDPDQILPLLFGDTDCYLVPDSTADILFSLPEGSDPHKLLLYSPMDQILATPAEIFANDRYLLSITLPEDEEGSANIANVYLYASIEDAMNGIPMHSLTLFPGMHAVDALLFNLTGYGFNVSQNP